MSATLTVQVYLASEVTEKTKIDPYCTNAKRLFSIIAYEIDESGESGSNSKVAGCETKTISWKLLKCSVELRGTAHSFHTTQSFDLLLIILISAALI